MSDRRDRKGRILRPGESQRADGQYMYRYTDALGDRRTVYSWTLVSTDKVPRYGKADCARRGRRDRSEYVDRRTGISEHDGNQSRFENDHEVKLQSDLQHNDCP